MGISSSSTKRIIGGGFALATAAALVVPGVASAGSLDSLTESVSADSIGDAFGNLVDGDGLKTDSLETISDSLGCFQDSGLGGETEITGIGGLLASVNVFNTFLGDCA